MSPVGFEPTISAGERPQTYALVLATAGTGKSWFSVKLDTTVLLRIITDLHMNYNCNVEGNRFYIAE